MTPDTPARRPYALAIWLIIAGIVGFYAAFALTLDKFSLLENPNASIGCNINLLVQCGANLNSPQGRVFGFPNPLLGLAGWTATIAMGTIILAVSGRIARWFWLLFNLGVAGALVLVIWLISQSIFSLGTLCPWCMVTWAVTIPTFFAVTFYNLKSGNIPLPAAGRRLFGVLYGWVWLISLVCYIVIALLAQVQLDWMSVL